MFKLVVLSALLAVAAARPGVLHSSPVLYSSPLVHEHGLASYGTIVKTIPSAVSHQSISSVHGPAHVVPILKSYSSPVLHTSYASPIISSPLAYSSPHLSLAASPLHYASPYGYASGW